VAQDTDQAAGRKSGLAKCGGCLLILAGLWVAQLCWATRISMYWLGLASQITGIALLICILVLLWRRNLLRAFPFFFSYVLYGLTTTIVGSITLSNPHVYFTLTGSQHRAK